MPYSTIHEEHSFTRMKIPNITPWTPEIEGQFCEEFWQLPETHKARRYTVVLGRKVVDILWTLWDIDDYATAVWLLMYLIDNDKASFVALLEKKGNKRMKAIILCMKKRAKNLFLPKGLPWTGNYYRFRRPDKVAKTFVSTEEEVQLYKKLFEEL